MCLSASSPQQWPSYPAPSRRPAAAACSWPPRPWRVPPDSDARAPQHEAPPRTGPACLGQKVLGLINSI